MLLDTISAMASIVFITLPSTADLTKEQFSEFIEQVMAFYHLNKE